MSKFGNLFGHRLDWRFRPGYSVVEDSRKPKQETARNSNSTESDKRKTPDQDEPNSKRVIKNFKCPTEPFFETLRILDELL